MHDQHSYQAAAAAQHEQPYWRALLHRWFVEYNPLYLLSAMLVLGGMILLSRGLAQDDSLYGQIGVAAIAEIYSVVLIGGAALLMRVGHRRSAVMLALLTVLYQCDLTLHTETCPNLGGIGVAATIGWMGLFIAKVRALGWAMKIRLSRATLATTVLGAAGLAIMPYLLLEMPMRSVSALVTSWLFAIAALHRVSGGFQVIASNELLQELDTWGHTVLRRAARATSMLLAGLLVLHVLFWTTQYHLDFGTIVFVAPLVAALWLRREKWLWLVVPATLIVAAQLHPKAFSITALIAALTLGVQAWLSAKTKQITTNAAAQATTVAVPAPYRASAEQLPVEVHLYTSPAAPPEPIVDARAVCERLIAGAVLSLYLSIWTIGWTRGSWPAHILPLDAVLAVLIALAAWKRPRMRIAIAPLAAVATHFIVKARLIPAPHSMLEWGGASVGIGFALLIGSIALSYVLRTKREPLIVPPADTPHSSVN